jgi:hypothetical protein
MKKIKYYIQQEIHQNNDWYNLYSESVLSKATKTYKSVLRNTKGDLVMANMKARQRILKVTEEVLNQDNSF